MQVQEQEQKQEQGQGQGQGQTCSTGSFTVKSRRVFPCGRGGTSTTSALGGVEGEVEVEGARATVLGEVEEATATVFLLSLSPCLSSLLLSSCLDLDLVCLLRGLLQEPFLVFSSTPSKLPISRFQKSNRSNK